MFLFSPKCILSITKLIKKLDCKSKNFRILVSVANILLISVVIDFCICNTDYNDAYANGFTKSNMVCSGFQNYKAPLCIGIFPIVLKEGHANNFSIKFELYDYVNKGIFPNATYDISVIKNEYDPILKDVKILSGIFHTRNGLFTIYISSSGKQEIENPNEGTLIKFNSSIRADRTNLTLPLELESGQYRIQSVVYVPNRQPLYYNSDLQIGDIKSKNIFFNKNVNNVTVVSYYDEITDLVFDMDKRKISWKIPFEYNVSKIEEGKVNVHEEIIIPNSFLNLTHTNNFNMTMNDYYFDSSLFKVDPYTFDDKTVIHYVPDTNTLFDISYNNSAVNNRMMKFDVYLR